MTARIYNRRQPLDASGRPILAEYNATLPDFTDGDVVIPQHDSKGRYIVTGQGDLSSAGADAGSNTANTQKVSSRVEGFNGTTWDRIRTGFSSVLTSLVGFLNTLPYSIYKATPTTRTDGQGGPILSDVNGNTKISMGTGLNKTDDAVTNYPAGCTMTTVDLATNADVVVTAAPAQLLGIYVNTVMSAHVANIQDNSTVKLILPASTAAGTKIDCHNAIFSTNITINSDDAATGELVIFWRAI